MKATALDRKEMTRLIEARRTDFVAALREIVECPSVSMQPDHRDDCRRAGRVACRLIEQSGGRAEMIETEGNPVVLGYFEGSPDAPTVSIYNHIDVQPAAEGRDGWTRMPFVFVEEGDRFYGRGTTDDKGPAITALFGVQLARQLGVETNFKLIWELEEEIGSTHFEKFLEDNRGKLDTDFVIISDTLWLDAGKPAIPYGLRGLCAARLVLETADKDAHSGVTGGAARNPIAELCQVIAGCFDARTGDITIEGFADTWQRVSKEEIDDFVASGFDRQKFCEAHNLNSLRYDDPRDITERIWARPTFEVHGMVGGYQDQGVKTVIPPRAEAKISFRLVPPQQPEPVLELLRRHVARLNPDVRVLDGHGIPGFIGAREGPLAEATADAFEFGFSARPVFIREGGSIGAVLHMEKHLGAPITFMGMSLPEHGYHGPNEFYDWGQASGGIAAFVYFFDRVASL